MKYVWRGVNFGLIILGVLEGYTSLAPDRLRNTNPDAIACLCVLVFLPLFSLISVLYSIKRWGHQTFRRPSFSRNPVNWWHDPLQSLFISTTVVAALFLGSLVRLPAVGTTAFWTSGLYFCMTLGLVIGQALNYKIFRHRIVPTPSE